MAIERAKFSWENLTRRQIFWHLAVHTVVGTGLLTRSVPRLVEPEVSVMFFVCAICSLIAVVALVAVYWGSFQELRRRKSL